MSLAKNPDLHGSVPNCHEVALVIIDMFNDFEFPGAKELLAHTRKIAPRIYALKHRLSHQGIPTIYVNDNFGKWRSDRTTLLRHFSRPSCKGKVISKLLHPESEDYFVIKTKHSIFYETGLHHLLRYLGTRKLILTGIAGDHCVFFSAAEASMRDFEIILPPDCCASIQQKEQNIALTKLQRLFHAKIKNSVELF